MNLSHQLQQEVEKWSKIQGISTEQFILEAVAEKVSGLNQQINPSTSHEARVYCKEGILVVETEPIGNLDINAFIDELREERIREQMAKIVQVPLKT